MKRNDDWILAPNENQTLIDQAFSIFVERARQENRNYFGDMVRDNLRSYLANKLTPQQAVDALFDRAP